MAHVSEPHTGHKSRSPRQRPQGLPTSVTPEPDLTEPDVERDDDAPLSTQTEDTLPENRPTEPAYRNKPHRGEDWGAFGHDEPPRRGTH